MAFADSSSPSLDRRNLIRFPRLRSSEATSADQNPLTPSSSSRPLLPAAAADSAKKKCFASPTFLGLGCASSTSSQAFAPVAAAAAVRSSADWQGNRTLRRRTKKKKKNSPSSSPVTPVAGVWCGPGIALASVDDSVDCVVSQRDVVGIGFNSDAERALREILLFQHRNFFERWYSLDQYRNLRLDVDNMTYEELLELGDKIGHVSTGLREEEIACSIRKVKHTFFDRRFSNETGRKCSICQEEFEMNVEVGELVCGHSYHPYCIKKWLIQKNACPVCKTTVTKI